VVSVGKPPDWGNHWDSANISMTEKGFSKRHESRERVHRGKKSISVKAIGKCARFGFSSSTQGSRKTRAVEERGHLDPGVTATSGASLVGKKKGDKEQPDKKEEAKWEGKKSSLNFLAVCQCGEENDRNLDRERKPEEKKKESPSRNTASTKISATRSPQCVPSGRKRKG